MKDIQKNNKLIAEFMGWKTHLTLGKDYFYNTDKKRPIYFYSDSEIRIDEFDYHQSWDWIMSVVKEIEEIDVVASFAIEQPTIYIWASSESSTFKDIEVDIFTMSKLEAVYKAAIEFIKWYNKNNENEKNKK